MLSGDPLLQGAGGVLFPPAKAHSATATPVQCHLEASEPAAVKVKAVDAVPNAVPTNSHHLTQGITLPKTSSGTRVDQQFIPRKKGGTGPRSWIIDMMTAGI